MSTFEVALILCVLRAIANLIKLLLKPQWFWIPYYKTPKPTYKLSMQPANYFKQDKVNNDKLNWNGAQKWGNHSYLTWDMIQLCKG